MASPGRGALIVIEGIDRVGKSTLCHRLSSELTSENKKVELMRFPFRDTKIGQCIDAYLSGTDSQCDQVIHLLFSANRWEMNKIMNQKLLDGTTLIVDRYAYSGVAYSAAKMTLSLDWCKAPDRGLIKPDLTVYLTADPEVISTRPGFGGEVYEKREFQTKVATMYDHLKEKDWKVITANGDPDDVLKNVILDVRNTIEKVKREEISKLWID